MSDLPTTLRSAMQFNPVTKEYTRAYMLRRLAQKAIMVDRDISQAEVARETGLSREAIRQYFNGDLWRGALGEEREEHATSRREKGEDRVERAIEAISARLGIVMPPAIPIVDQAITRELMKASA